MNILVIGGTRLLGLNLVKHLLTTDNNITVLSRHPEKCPVGVECIGMEREEGLVQLSGRKFDMTLDFIAYDESAPTQVFNCFNPGVYVLISSTWLMRLAPSILADQPVAVVNDACARILPDITYSYLIGKMHAEASVLEMRKKNGSATILRLPIFWGYGEHTGRLDFYRHRIMDGAPVICVNGGNNYVQIVWDDDAARVVAAWLYKAAERPIWEALPDKGTRVRDVIELIAVGLNRKPVLVNVSSKQLSVDLPDYLSEEPLWRETSINMTKSNLFTTIGMKPTPQNKWLCNLVRSGSGAGISELRKKEIKFLEKNSDDTKFIENSLHN